MRRFVGHHKSVPAPVVDGVSGPENIANLWCSNFKQLYNTLDGSASTDVLCALDSGISHDVLYQTSISAEVIEVAIGKSKRGKSDGDTLMSDHIIEAPSSHCQFLACLFTSMLRHGFMPSSFRDLLFSQYPKGPRIHPCLQIIAELLLPPLSVKSWSGLFFSPGSRSSLPVTYSLGLSQAFPPHYALVY